MLSYAEQYFYFVMLAARGIGPVALDEIRSAVQYSTLDIEAIGESFLRGIVPASLLLRRRHTDAIENAIVERTIRDFDSALSAGQWIIGPNDPLLPSGYWTRANIHRLPKIFVAAGTPPPTEYTWYAAIGSRDASPQQVERARNGGTSNADRDIVTVGGGARGIDRAAVDACISNGGWSVVVHAKGLNPSHISNPKTLDLTPFYPGSAFSAGLAMARNAIVVAASSVVQVYAVKRTRAETGKATGTEDAIERANAMGVPIEDYSAKQ